MKDFTMRSFIRISLLYVLLGGVWIIAVDTLTKALVPDADQYATLKILHGWAILAASAVVLERVTSRDIKWREAAKAMQRTVEARFAAILDISTKAVISGRRRAHRPFNKGAENIFGYRADEVMGKSTNIPMPGRFVENHRRRIHRFLAGPSASQQFGKDLDLFGLHKDGIEFPVDAGVSRQQEDGRTPDKSTCSHCSQYEKTRLPHGNFTGGRRRRTPSSRSSTGPPRETGEGRPGRSPAPRSLPPRPAR